jgi:hypothetical protein
MIGRLRWDLTPQTASVGENGTFVVNSQEDLERFKQLRAEKAGSYFYVDVWNCQARLALMTQDALGNGKIEVVSDFHSPLLEKAVYQAGGCITTSGWYPLNKQLISLLKRKLLQ